MKPDISKLKDCMSSMAKAMGLKTPPAWKCDLILNHILYEQEFNGVEGKNGLNSFTSQFITEREFRNLVMAHCSTKIASYNDTVEPDCYTYSNKELCDNFDLALIDRLTRPTVNDVFEPWDKNI